MEVFLQKLGTVDRYNFNCPPDPSPVAIAREYNDVQQICGSAQFRHPYGDKGAHLVSGKGWVTITNPAILSLNKHCDRFFLALNNEADSQRDQREILRVMGAPEETDRIAHYFYEKMRKLITLKLYLLTDKNIKFVDVLRYVPLHWATTELVCEFEMFM